MVMHCHSNKVLGLSLMVNWAFLCGLSMFFLCFFRALWLLPAVQRCIVGRLTGNSELAVNVSVSLQVRLCPCVTVALGGTGTLSRGYIASCPTAAGTGFRCLQPSTAGLLTMQHTE